MFCAGVWPGLNRGVDCMGGSGGSRAVQVCHLPCPEGPRAESLFPKSQDQASLVPKLSVDRGFFGAGIIGLMDVILPFSLSPCPYVYLSASPALL